MAKPPVQVPLWVDELPPARDITSRYNWPAIAAILRANPGRWACVLIQQPHSLDVAIRGNRIEALRPTEEGHFEVRLRNTHRSGGKTHPPRLSDYYMRWTPNTEEEA